MFNIVWCMKSGLPLINIVNFVFNTLLQKSYKVNDKFSKYDPFFE